MQNPSHPFQKGMSNLLPTFFPPTAKSTVTGIWLLRFYAPVENTLRIQRFQWTMQSTDDAEQRVLISNRPSRSAEITMSILIIQ